MEDLCRTCTKLFYLLLFLLATSYSTAFCQQSQKGIEVNFLRKRTAGSTGDISSNVLRIKNNTSKVVSFTLNIVIPDGWLYITKKNRVYEIGGRDSLFIPITLTPKRLMPGNISHVINASLVGNNELPFASALWYMTIKKESNWTASLTYNKIFFLDDSDTAHFSVHLQNMGNADEDIKINFNPERRLKVLDPKHADAALHYFFIKLPVDADTLLTFNVKKIKPVEVNFREDFESGRPITNDYYTLRLTAQNQQGSLSKIWRSTVDFIKAGTESRLKEHNSSSIPLTVETNVDNFLDNSTMMSVGMYGTAQLEKNRSLSYRYQTFFVNSFYSTSSYIGNSHYLNYITPRWSLELGEISGNGGLGFASTGRGIKVNYNISQNHSIGAFYLRNSGFFDLDIGGGYGFSYGYHNRRMAVENYLSSSENKLFQSSSKQYTNRLRFSLARGHSVNLSSAVTYETFNSAAPLSQLGYAYTFGYNGSYNKLSVNLQNTFGSQFSQGNRGTINYGGNLSYRLTSHSSLAFAAFTNTQNPSFFSPVGMLLGTYKNQNDRLELSYNVQKPGFAASLRLQHLRTEALTLRSESSGMGFDYRPKTSKDLRFSFSASGAYVRLLDFDLDPYFSSQIRTNFRYKGFSTNIRYVYGPYQAYDQLIFANTKIASQALFSNTSMKFWILKDRLTFEPSGIYSYETLYKRNRISFRPELFYLPMRSFEIRAYGQYVRNAQNNSLLQTDDLLRTRGPVAFNDTFFGLGLKKKIGVPVSAKKYFNLNVSVFKDLNGNGKQDKDEQGLRNILVNVKPLDLDTSTFIYTGLKDNGEHFVTNESGKISYKNLPKGRYQVKIVPLSQNEGFFAGNEQVVTLKDDKNLMMPLNQGVQLTGILVAERDESAADYDTKLDLAKIRVIALDSLGKSFSTLTDRSGRFNMRLPAGIYQVSISDSALPENFELEQKSLPVEMFVVSDNYDITFLIRERKRKKVIKKFDSNGNIIEKK